MGLSTAELWRHNDFQDGGRQPCWIWFRAMVGHPRSASGGLCFILKFRLENRSNSSTWAQDREKRTGEDSQKSQRRYISPIWGEVPTEPIFTKICTVAAVPDIFTCANFWAEIFRGYDFTGGSNFPFSYWFFHGPYNSAALLRCLWLSFVCKLNSINS